MAAELRLACVRLGPQLVDCSLDDLLDQLWRSGVESLGDVRSLDVSEILDWKLEPFDLPAVKSDSRVALANGFPGRAVLAPPAARALWSWVSKERAWRTNMWRDTGYPEPADDLDANTARVRAALDGLGRDDIVVAEIWDTA